MEKEKNLHEGHRNRLKNRFLENGLDKFEPHNILELLLFYSIPRKDTNDIAHELIKKFGSLSAVFDANFEDLIKVNYITENSATLIKLIPEISRAYLLDRVSHEFNVTDLSATKELLLSLFHGQKNENVYVLFVSNNFNLLGYEKIHEGSVNSSIIDTRRIIEYAIKYNASMLIFAHNHPIGSAYPSMDDIETTGNLISIFRPFSFPIIEHFVVNEVECYPIIHNTASLKSGNEENKRLFGEIQ